MSEPVTPQDLIRWSEALAGIARTGLGFTQSLYERERFEEVLKVASDIRAAAFEEAEADVRRVVLEHRQRRLVLGVLAELLHRLHGRDAVAHPHRRDSESVGPGCGTEAGARGAAGGIRALPQVHHPLNHVGDDVRSLKLIPAKSKTPDAVSYS